MVSLDKCRGSCNILSPKVYVPKETKDTNVKAFNLITNQNKLKQWRNIFLVMANSIAQHVIQIKNGIIKHTNVNFKIIVIAKRL